MEGKMRTYRLTFFMLLACGMFLVGQEKTAAALGGLTPEQYERVKACKDLLAGIDNKSLEATVEELTQSKTPEADLQISEAIAKTYAELVKEYQVESKERKEWLFSMVQLNMGYLRLGGGQNQPEGALNGLIWVKLKKYLSPDLLNDSKLFYSIEQ
jgi:hypothetical protein